MSFDQFDIQDLVKDTQRAYTSLFNFWVEVDDVYVDEIGEDNYDFEVYLVAHGSATINSDYDFNRLKDGIQSAGRTVIDRIDDRLRQYHYRYGFGYRVRVEDLDTSDVDIDSY